MSENGSVLKAGIWYTIGNFLIKGIGFITMPLFTRILFPEQIGEFSNMSSWLALLAIITTLDLYTTMDIARFDFKNNFDEYKTSILVLSSLFTLGCYIFCVIFKQWTLQIFGFTDIQLHVTFLYLLSYPAILIYQKDKQYIYDSKSIIVISILTAGLSTFVSLGCVLLFSDRLLGRILGYYIPMIIINSILCFLIIKKSRVVRLKYWKYAVPIAVPLVFHLLAGYVLNSSDILMIKHFQGASETAYYSVAASLGAIVQILWTSMNSAWAPWSLKMMNECRQVELKKYSKPYAIGFMIIVIAAMMVSPEVLWILGGKEYSDAKYVIPPIMVGYILQFMYSMYVNVELYLKQQKTIMFGTMIAAVLNLVLNYIFLPRFGYVAAAYTTCVCYLALFIIHYLAVKYKSDIEWYDGRFILVLVGIALMSMVLLIHLYKYNFVRWSIIGVFGFCVGIAIIRYRKKILESIKTRSLVPIIECIKSEKSEDM